MTHIYVSVCLYYTLNHPLQGRFWAPFVYTTHATTHSKTDLWFPLFVLRTQPPTVRQIFGSVCLY